MYRFKESKTKQERHLTRTTMTALRGRILATFATVVSLQIINFSNAAQLAKCSVAVVNPKAGLCSGKAFTYKVCTGDAPWYMITSDELSNQTADFISSLESYTWENCTSEITATCKSFLPTTSVSTKSPQSRHRWPTFVTKMIY